MRRELKLHPDCTSRAVDAVIVEMARPLTGALSLRYIVAGRIDDVIIPPPSEALRRDGLWRNTCFEAFVRLSPRAPYYEFNLSPSTEWAAYRFASYRTGISVDATPPEIAALRGRDRYELRVSLVLPDLDVPRPWELGLSAVIEEGKGHKSYWALAHPPGRPDFHHDDCFAVQLPPAP